MSNSRVDWLIEVLGGPQNLPPQLPPPPVEEKSTPLDDDEEPPPIVRDPNIVRPSLLCPRITPALSILPPASEDVDFAIDSRKGEHAPLGFAFTPFPALTKYCYKFVPRQWSQPLASAFFDQDKIYQRDWELYYVHSDYAGVITFVPEHQLLSLVDEINLAFPKAQLIIGDEERDNHLVIDFDDLCPELRPRWLGRCNSRPKYNSWLYELQQESAMAIPDSAGCSFEVFKVKMDQALEASKKKTKAARKQKHAENVMKRQDMVRQTLRAQRYLGLLPKKEDSVMPDIASLSITELDFASPPPHPFDNEPIFIAIDVEAWEKAPRMITEVGVATLDTRDLKGIAPGDVGQDWHKHIRGRHFRIIEYKNYVNGDFVQGCPDSFEFGQSEFVGKDNIASVLASCFRKPFSKDISQDFPALRGNPTSTNEETEKRNIIVVGHDLGGDISYCHQLGFSVLNRGNILDTLDTINMYRAYAKTPNSDSLGSILLSFDLSGWHLHNAGNDAVYTVQVMLAICVKSATERGTKEAAKKHEEKKGKPVEASIENAMERASEESED